MKTLIMSALLAFSLHAQTDNTFCWKNSFPRGAGTLPGFCDDGFSKELAACYTTCRAGFSPYLPATLTCEQECPSGWTNLAGSCGKPAAYPNGAGYPWQGGDTPFDYSGALDRCTNDHPDTGCSLQGLLAYPNCKAGYKFFGGNVCTPVCPDGMVDAGAFCFKQVYSREMRIPGCGSGMEKDGALCYPQCGQGYDGVGPVCWGQCPVDHPVQCGAACAVSEAACTAAVGNIALSTVSVALNVGSFVLGGPGLSTAWKEGIEAAETGMAKSILAHAPESGEALLLNSSKAYALDFSKQFVKTIVKNQLDPANLYWRALKASNSAMIYALNQASMEYGVEKHTGVFDLSMLTALDPTGLSSLVTSFTKFGSCNSSQFALDRSELDFGPITSPVTQAVTLIAQRPTTVTRIVSPVFTNASITATASCAGKKLDPGQTCSILVTVNSQAKLDADLRIYSDALRFVPMTIHILANSGATTLAQTTPNGDEDINLTAVAGAWAFNGNQNQKLVINSDGSLPTTGGGLGGGLFGGKSTGPGGAVSVKASTGRAFSIQTYNPITTKVYTLSETGDRLTGSIVDGPISLPQLGRVLDVWYISQDVGASVGANPANGGLNQSFHFDMLDDGTYRIIAAHSGKVLDVWGLSKDPGAPVRQNDWNAGYNQKFRVEPVGDGSYFKIVSVYSGLALTSLGDGVEISQQAWTDSPGQRFSVATTGTYVRRPWDSGCNPGETRVAGLCYDVPVGKAVTSPGFMGNICPTDWRDDGISCFPPWTGPSVDTIADPNGSDNMRWPVSVTSATAWDKMGHQCPANWTHTIGYTCIPNSIGKDIKSLIGSIPH